MVVLFLCHSGCGSCRFLDRVGSSSSVQTGRVEGKVKPDYKQAVEISTTAAQKELVSLALLGIVTPIVVGLLLQVEALGGFLAGIIVSGQLLAVFLNNSGGAWDNAKKLIEDEPKRSEEEYRQRLRTSQSWRGR